MPQYPGVHQLREVMLSRRRLITAAGYYCGQYAVTDPLISVVNGDFTGLPPTLIQVGSDELLLDDSLRLADNMRRDKVPVDKDVFPGMWHVFQLHAGTLSRSDEAIARIAAFIQRSL